MSVSYRVGFRIVICGVFVVAMGIDTSLGQSYTDFEGFTLGSSVDGQGGWRSTNPLRDEEIVSLSGNEVWRVSNAFANGSFGDQPIAPGSDQYAGETGGIHEYDSAVANTNRFYASFDFWSVTGAAQPGLDITISPDDGAGRRQSFISLEDDGSGLNIDFYDTHDNDNGANANEGFVQTYVATGLSYATRHHVVFDITFVDGNVESSGVYNGNDIVNIYVDGALVHTGTTWESYWQTTTEGQTPPSVRAVDTLLFRVSTPQGATAGAGYYFDNVYISNAPPPVLNLTSGGGYETIQAAIDAATSGDTISVSAGTYVEDVTIPVQVTLIGVDGPENTTVSGPANGGFATFDINASGTIIDGFTITREGNSLATWNDPLNSAGISIQGAGNVEVRNCILTGNRSAIDINASSGNSIHHNRLDFNHTGMILRNGCPGNIVENNEVTNNRTVGILWLPTGLVADATGCRFQDNKIEGNWYAEIENRSTDGGLKDFSANWLGTTAPTVSAALGGEPPYSTHVPVEFGGTAVAPTPGSQPTIKDATALYDYSPWLDSNADTDGGSLGFSGDFSVLNVDDDSPQSGATSRIQEGIDLVSGSTVNVLPGTYPGNLSLVDDVTLQSTGGAGSTTIEGAGGCAVTINGDSVTIDGFTITNPTGTNAICSDDHSIIAIRNNVVTNIGGPTVGGNHHAIIIESSAAAVDDVTIEDNNINSVFGSEVLAAKGSCSGIVVGFSPGNEDITNLIIQNNTISNINAFTADFGDGGRGAYGIQLNHSVSGSGVTDGAQILNNTISDLEGLWAHGIGLEGKTPNALLQGNDISDLTDHKMPSDAVGVMIEDNPTASSVEIHYNSFTNMAVGINNTESSTIVNAENNYWGSDSGPNDPSDDAGETSEVDFMTCTMSPENEFNADGAGSGIYDNSSGAVDYCPWLMGQGTLSLEVAGACPDDANAASGYQVEVQLWMRDLLDPATGYQAFMTYDTGLLTYRGDLSSYSGSPYPAHIGGIAFAESSPGVISLNGFEDPMAPIGGTTVDSLLATLVFDVDVDCSSTSFAFDTSPASELSFEGVPLATGNVPTSTVTLDDTPPVITTGMIAACYPSAAAAEADAVSITSFSDNCGGAVSTDFVVAGTCSATITVTATDDCGNESMHVYNTRIDGDAPTATAGTIDPCYATVMDAETAAIADAMITASDNCTASLDFAASTLGDCSATITVTITDECDNFIDLIYVTSIDNTPPSVPTPGTLPNAWYPTVAAAEAAAEADAMSFATDNCPGGLSYSSTTVGDCSATVTVTVSDFCNNSTDVMYATRIDNTPPSFDPCPSIGPVPADAGVCTAEVTLSASAMDNCDGAIPPAEIEFTIDDNGTPGFDAGDSVVVGSGSTFDFEVGVTNVRASATDDCMNTGTCDFTVTVSDVNLVNVVVVLDAVAFDGVRNIRFTAKGPLGCATPVCEPITFASTMGGIPSTGIAQIAVPCGDWDSICAKDEQHTLIASTALVLNGVEFDAPLDLVLYSGDTDNDSDVDINDVTLFIAQFGMSYGGLNPCPYNNVRDSDFSLNGVVGGEDFSILQPNWLLFSSCGCPSPFADDTDVDVRPIKPNRIALDSIRTRLNVRDLAPDVSAHADLDRDGEITFKDIRIFENTHGFTHELSESLRQVDKMKSGNLPNSLERRAIEATELRPRR